MPQIKFEKKFGQSSVFIASTLMEEGGVPKGASSASLLKEAIHVISCGYEDKTEWGKEVCIPTIPDFTFWLLRLFFLRTDISHSYCLILIMF